MRQPRRVDVGEDRPRAHHHHRQRRIGRRQRRRDHFVAGPDIERPQNQRDRVGAGADADGVRGAHRRGEFRFERFDLGPEHEPAARDDAFDRHAHGCRVVGFRRERKERNPRPRHRVSCSRGEPST